MENAPLRVAVYVRVSKIDQHPENQLLELKQRADKEGWEATYFEEKESTRDYRPIKEDVLKAVMRGDYDAILVWKRDRWARSIKELLGDLSDLLGANRRFISHTEGLDYSSTKDRLLIHIFASFAEFERDLISERTKLGLARARAEGKKLGRPRKKGIAQVKDVLTPEPISGRITPDFQPEQGKREDLKVEEGASPEVVK